jgi:predicted DNA-binding protein
LTIHLPVNLYQKIHTKSRNLNKENSTFIENIIAEYFGDPVQGYIEAFVSEKVRFVDNGCESIKYAYECFSKHFKNANLTKQKFMRLMRAHDNRIKIERAWEPGKKPELIFSGIWVDREGE